MPTHHLSGLDRLLEVVRKQGLPVETLPPGSSPLRAGAHLYEMPIDSLLAAAFSRCGKLIIKNRGSEKLLLMRRDDEVDGFLLENQEWQNYFPHEFWPEHFRALVLFGGEMLYRYATVPELANSEGRQPVVRVDPYEDIHALPVASDVDHFFDTYSRYVELMVNDPGYRSDGIAWIRFPYDVPELIAKDVPLIGMIKEGRFDRLMYERDKTGRRDESAIASTREWVSRLVR